METAHPKLDQVQSIFKNLVWDNLIEAAIRAFFIYVPWLNIWPIAGAVRYILLIFTNHIFDSLKLVVDLQAIALLNEQHKNAYNRQLAKLKIIAREKGIESDEFKQERENAKKELARFVGYNAVP